MKAKKKLKKQIIDIVMTMNWDIIEAGMGLTYDMASQSSNQSSVGDAILDIRELRNKLDLLHEIEEVEDLDT